MNTMVRRLLKTRKFKNIKSGGYDSKKERQFAENLKMLMRANDEDVRVVKIEEQVRFNLIPEQRDESGRLLERRCDYIADFRVTRANGKVDVFDVKGYKTPEYIIKRKLMLKVHNIKVVEV